MLAGDALGKKENPLVITPQQMAKIRELETHKDRSFSLPKRNDGSIIAVLTDGISNPYEKAKITAAVHNLDRDGNGISMHEIKVGTKKEAIKPLVITDQQMKEIEALEALPKKKGKIQVKKFDKETVVNILAAGLDATERAKITHAVEIADRDANGLSKREIHAAFKVEEVDNSRALVPQPAGSIPSRGTDRS